MRFDSKVFSSSLVPRWLVRVGALLVMAGASALFGQQCVPPPGRADSGTMVATALFRGGGLTVQNRGEIYDLDPPKGQRDAFVTFHKGDVVEFSYSGLLQCRKDYTATVLRIAKKGTSPTWTVPVPDLQAITIVIADKQEMTNDRVRPDSRLISAAKYGPFNWTFGVSLDDPLFPTLRQGDRLRIIYFDAAPVGTGGQHFGRILEMKLAVPDSLQTISASEITYSAIYQRGFSPELISLRGGCLQPSANCAGVIEDALAAGMRDGYRFTYIAAAPDASGRINRFKVLANPLDPGEEGARQYYVDESGVIRWELDRPAGPNSPPI